MPFILPEILLVLGLMSEAGVDHFDVKEVTCLAQNIYHEARGESPTGRRAVAHVTLNRVKSPRYPDTICEVVYQPEQFSWTASGPGDLSEPAAFENALVVAINAMSGLSRDPTGGADHYYNHHKVTPYWSASFETTRVIGQHTFQKDETAWR